MRNLIYAINVTLDGCCDHTKTVVGPGGPGSEVYEHYINLLREVDLIVYGRKTWRLMVPYWPDVAKDHSKTDAAHEFARTFDPIEKLVFSRSLESAEDPHSRIVRDLRDEILKQKQQPGKDMMVGGVDLPSQLIELGLVDEFRFVVSPIIAGAGRRLFDGVNLAQSLELKLVESKNFQSGAIALRYRKQ